VNNEDQKIDAKPDTFVTIDRTWAGGDHVTLKLPMALKVRVWEKNKDAISIGSRPAQLRSSNWRRNGNAMAAPTPGRNSRCCQPAHGTSGLIVDEQS